MNSLQIHGETFEMFLFKYEGLTFEIEMQIKCPFLMGMHYFTHFNKSSRTIVMLVLICFSPDALFRMVDRLRTVSYSELLALLVCWWNCAWYNGILLNGKFIGSGWFAFSIGLDSSKYCCIAESICSSYFITLDLFAAGLWCLNQQQKQEWQTKLSHAPAAHFLRRLPCVLQHVLLRQINISGKRWIFHRQWWCCFLLSKITSWCHRKEKTCHPNDDSHSVVNHKNTDSGEWKMHGFVRIIMQRVELKLTLKRRICQFTSAALNLGGSFIVLCFIFRWYHTKAFHLSLYYGIGVKTLNGCITYDDDILNCINCTNGRETGKARGRAASRWNMLK